MSFDSNLLLMGMIRILIVYACNSVSQLLECLHLPRNVNSLPMPTNGLVFMAS